MYVIAALTLLALAAVSQAARCDGSAGSADSQCCFACEILLNEVLREDFFHQIHNANDAKVALERACDVIGIHFEDDATCRMWVDANYVSIYNQLDGSLRNHTDPHARTICTNINECPPQRMTQRNSVKNIECTICEAIFTEVKKEIPQVGTLTKDVLEGLVKKACDKLGGAISSFCTQALDGVLDAALDFINKEGNDFDVKQLCLSIKMCKS
uniref:Saposin B-type domain-containing protein n=1 Tax=Plectus sambesii TaxID=2011161 RepID=A0A914WHX6_9BILA